MSVRRCCRHRSRRSGKAWDCASYSICLQRKNTTADRCSSRYGQLHRVAPPAMKVRCRGRRCGGREVRYLCRGLAYCKACSTPELSRARERSPYCVETVRGDFSSRLLHQLVIGIELRGGHPHEFIRRTRQGGFCCRTDTTTAPAVAPEPAARRYSRYCCCGYSVEAEGRPWAAPLCHPARTQTS
jgi:hypothetical protein